MNRSQFSRRESIKLAAGAAIGILGHSSGSQAAEDANSDGLEVNIAGYAYDRVRSIQDGRSGLDGCTVKFHTEDIYNLNGDVDALITAIEPKAYIDGHPKVRRLFSDVQAAERDYSAKARVFPIMHVVAIRTDFAEANPELPEMLFRMYSQAKDAAYEDLKAAEVLKVTLPWVNQELETTRALMGDNYWPYGVKANRKELDLVMRYTHEQGLAKRRLGVDEVFHPSTLELTET